MQYRNNKKMDIQRERIDKKVEKLPQNDIRFLNVRMLMWNIDTAYK